MDYQLPINLAVLKAADAYASREEARYYLNGVHVEADETGIYYVATNGHVLFARRETADAPPNPFVGSLIIPSKTIAHFKIEKKHSGEAMLTIGARHTVDYRGDLLTFRPIDGHFPDWRRVLPKASDAVAPGQFNPEYIGLLGKTAKQLKFGMPYIRHAGESSAALVTWEGVEDTIAVIMPRRGTPTTPPTWAAAQQAA